VPENIPLVAGFNCVFANYVIYSALNSPQQGKEKYKKGRFRPDGKM
jgi:hypothetical protein